MLHPYWVDPGVRVSEPAAAVDPVERVLYDHGVQLDTVPFDVESSHSVITAEAAKVLPFVEVHAHVRVTIGSTFVAEACPLMVRVAVGAA